LRAPDGRTGIVGGGRRAVSTVQPLQALLRGRTGFAAVVQTGLATTLVLGINVVTGIVSARFLGAEGRGWFAVLVLCPQFLSFLFTLGLPGALIFNVKNHPDRAWGFMGAALTLSAIAGALGAVVGFFVLPPLMVQYPPWVLSLARAFLV